MTFFAVVFTLVIAWQLFQAYRAQTLRVGDGVHVESYGFDLSPLLVERELLSASGRPKDSLPVLGEVTVIDLDQSDRLGEFGPMAVTTAVLDAERERAMRGWRRMVVDDDPVIGIVVNGEARAYPIRYIRWHEIINDRLGGVPIAVTYSLLCDSAAVFDRRMDGQTLEFGFSGLVYNSNLVMYDKRSDAAGGDAQSTERGGDADGLSDTTSSGESLWSQLLMRAIAGPAAEDGRELTALPMWYGRWGDWRKALASTTLFIGDRQYRDRYTHNPLPPGYFNRFQPAFPVRPLPGDDSPLGKMDRVLAVGRAPGQNFRGRADQWSIVPLGAAFDRQRINRILEGSGITAREDQTELTLEPVARPAGYVEDEAGPERVTAIVHSRWFAWYAMHGDEGLVTPVGDVGGGP